MGLICIYFILIIKRIKIKLRKDIPIYLYSAGAIGVFTVWQIKLDLSISVHLWAYLGGLIGVIAVAGPNIVTPKISAFYLTLIIFAGLTYNLVIDKKALSDVP